MLGMDQVQRSNAVGANTSYLPSGDTGRDGGGTYSGQATEPTLQDYENFFGPSARDIKTDLQRFKRHGRWHLPDVLQGPNPWLTDRIDGLITDATNSPFTTKILPYRYKEDVDGKIKWNVWSFDEGMASRVPYEAAARTLTQSKRSFAGYMVRSGLAISLEHNFMMTPKGRENFRNQLNQLIGSIQYSNDLDVHMALILAPSYQQTMRERYYSTDKSPAQLCREYADLFGMMQKNVNALDILIEEGKAVLRTWGGPMPDFLLCNSKLTFQMTMTPEKTNYITQGIDGVKRLRQGPDLGSYRGLSVIHTRSFAMETGQHPRDVLRRRVRTAEYYRIPPDVRNKNREFEFYNEERDNWFTLSFQDLLRCARYQGSAFGGTNNSSDIDAIFHGLSSAGQRDGAALLLGSGRKMELGVSLGAYAVTEASNAAALRAVEAVVREAFQNPTAPRLCSYSVTSCDIKKDVTPAWVFHGFFYRMGVQYVEPVDNEVWNLFNSTVDRRVVPDLSEFSLGVSPLRRDMLASLFLSCKKVPLNDPFRKGKILAVGSGGWYTAYLFYLECIKRKGIPLDWLKLDGSAMSLAASENEAALVLMNAELNNVRPPQPDITNQLLGMWGAVGCVNHPLHLICPRGIEAGFTAELNVCKDMSTFMARRMLMSLELLEILLSSYTHPVSHKTVKGIDMLEYFVRVRDDDLEELMTLVQVANRNDDSFMEYNKSICRRFVDVLGKLFGRPTHQVNFEELAQMGISSIPMFGSTLSHLCKSVSGADKMRQLADRSGGQLSLDMIDEMSTTLDQNYPFIKNLRYAAPDPGVIAWANDYDNMSFVDVLRERLFMDPVNVRANELSTAATNSPRDPVEQVLGGAMYDLLLNQAYNSTGGWPSKMSNDRLNMTIDLNKFFDKEDEGPAAAGQHAMVHHRIEDVEIVVIRPNIEHNMLGVIMGLGGNELGNTLWGQTELSVYDDSMHGLWGMSYKYHERAIVFNEKNLIRMWDIAYDGYNGGKDDTYVDWTEENTSNGYGTFKEATINLGKNYRGPSMMVLAFVHDRARTGSDGRNVYNHHFKRNWPSPVVFYDSYAPGRSNTGRETLAIDYDNLQTVDVEEFRVFNNELYGPSYLQYREMMPDFRSLHVTRKSAGQSSADAETGTDCLAFQGSMRIKENGVIVQDIQGSGHHGPDYVGVASVRAGKGQKTAGQQPTLHRLI